MSDTPNPLPNYYFRLRENGALVFRIINTNRTQRLEMEQIAMVNVKNGEIRAHKNHTLTKQDKKEIEAWRDARQALLAQRRSQEAMRCVEQLNALTQWIQRDATDSDLTQIEDDLLLAMHDLRSTLVRRNAAKDVGS